MNVIIDNVKYIPAPETYSIESYDKAMTLLAEIHCSLWMEANYEPFSQETEEFAAPLSAKMSEVNSILKFKK